MTIDPRAASLEYCPYNKHRHCTPRQQFPSLSTRARITKGAVTTVDLSQARLTGALFYWYLVIPRTPSQFAQLHRPECTRASHALARQLHLTTGEIFRRCVKRNLRLKGQSPSAPQAAATQSLGETRRPLSTPSYKLLALLLPRKQSCGFTPVVRMSIASILHFS